VSLEVAEARDPKGLYAKARRGELKDFTGVSAPYEEPQGAEIVIKSGEVNVEDAVRQIVTVLEDKGLMEKAKTSRQDGDKASTD
jgi:adenylylsulfate kinase